MTVRTGEERLILAAESIAEDLSTLVRLFARQGHQLEPPSWRADAADAIERERFQLEGDR